MDKATQIRVRDLNYDHHRRMTDLHTQRTREGKIEEFNKIDDLSYRALLKPVPKDRTAILELGSSKGQQFPLLSEWLSVDGLIYGIDLYEPNVRAAQFQGLNIAVGYVEDMRIYPDGIFDLVCSRHVLEHLGDIRDGVSEIMRVTKPGGFIANVTPDLQFDNEPAHLNKLNLQDWTVLWVQSV